MTESEKLQWEKPELIIINRCHVEENVLAYCNEQSNPACGHNTAQGLPS